MIGNSFLRVSDFCRPDHEENVSIEVSLFLWLANVNDVRCKTDQRPPLLSSSSVSSSLSSVARVSLAVLKRLNLQQDDIASLGDSSSHHHRPVAVRLELMEEWEEQTLRQQESNNHGDCLAVCIPPIVATNLGISPHTLLDVFEHSQRRVLIDSEDGATNVPPSLLWQKHFLAGDFFISNMESRTPPNANHIRLQPLSRAVGKDSLYRPLPQHTVRRGGAGVVGNDNHSHTSHPEEDAINNNRGDDRSNNSSNSNEWIFPSAAGALLQTNRLIAVPDPRNHGVVFYYQVLQVTTIKQAAEDQSLAAQSTTRVDVAITDSQTTFELDSAPLPASVPRLPPLDLQAMHFESSVWKRQSANEKLQTEAPKSACIVPPHPNLHEVSRAFIHPAPPVDSSSYVDLSTRILHMVGSDAEHDLCQCIESASHLAGYQCLHIRGLAAFAYNQGHVLRQGGGLLDQLSGLSSALDYIHTQRMEPCVLHLQNINAELNAVDQPLQQEQQDRFWVKLLEGLNRYSRSASDPDRNSNGTYIQTPPLLVVLSTSEPLQPGPWMEHLVFPSIALSTPDDPYIRHLWGKDDKNLTPSDSILSQRMMTLLRGRSAQEIRTLRRELEMMDDDTAGAPVSPKHEDRLKQACDELDKNRRKATSTISKISPVHWNDVGGLQHVRAEIMDAIELPLKHPHLFPSHGGRSGILLFGPPGTGKTLVAKAVATECQLPFLSVKGPELLGSYVGESEANVRKVFASAREAAATNLPIAAAILFFDELDSLAPRRGGVDHGGGVMERVVASLLAELDGPSGSGKNDGNVEGRVFVLGATNRPDLLDPALLRPGRLDRLVYLGIATDDEERVKVLASQLQKMPLEGDAVGMARSIVRHLPPRLSGADLAKISSGAMLNAVQRLCAQAENERRLQPDLSIDQILDCWGEEKCTPIITMKDLLLASKDCAPSVSEEELQRYERLRETIKQE